MYNCCLYFRIDNKYRLPNWDYCPPHYNPEGWRTLKSMRRETSNVIDLKSFCHMLGSAANILVGLVENVRVKPLKE